MVVGSVALPLGSAMTAQYCGQKSGYQKVMSQLPGHVFLRFAAKDYLPVLGSVVLSFNTIWTHEPEPKI